MKKLITVLAVMAILIGCSKWQNPQFRQAWELIEYRPDSAKSILDKVGDTALSESGQAEYGLLKTIVDYKTLGKIKNDSLISASIAYYDRHGDDWHLGRAYLYRGALRIYRSLDIPNAILDTIVIDHDTLVAGKMPEEYEQDAVKDLKTAEAIAEDADDEELKNHAYELMAYSNICFNDYPRVLKYSHKWLDSSIKLNDSIKILRSLFMCASTYHRMGQTDSATIFTKKGVELAKHADAWLPTYEEYSKRAEICLMIGEIKNAEDSLRAWEEMKNYQIRAQALKEQGKYEDAIRELKLGIEHSDRQNRLQCLELIYEIYKLTGDQEQASLTKMQMYNAMVTGRANAMMDDWQKNLDEERKTKNLNQRLSGMQELIIVLSVIVAIAIIAGMWWHRRKVSRLSNQLDEDARHTSELNTKVGLLENRMEHISNTLLIGTQMYNQLQQRQCIAEATAKELQSLVDYFSQLRPKRWQDWERKYKNLSTAQYVFLILQDDLHYDDETIASILDVKRTSVRSMRSRIKSRER